MHYTFDTPGLVQGPARQAELALPGSLLERQKHSISEFLLIYCFRWFIKFWCLSSAALGHINFLFSLNFLWWQLVLLILTCNHMLSMNGLRVLRRVRKSTSSLQLCPTLCDPMDFMQHARIPCPSPTPGVHPDPCLLSRWYHPTVLPSVIPFSSCLQSFPGSGSFLVSQFFASGGQRIAISTSASVLAMNIQGWFPLG